ncbi:DUF6468 domain-containing protein [Litoreibacter arenae]|nr:DUF6468 domain-containing protein [Litoreibacter arenae]
MDFLADILLGFGAIAAAIYCFVLSRKLSKLRGLDQELGSAIAVLSRQVDEMTRILSLARETAGDAASELQEKTDTATSVADRLEFMIAALQDVTDLERVADERFEEEVENSRSEVNVFIRNAARKVS